MASTITVEPVRGRMDRRRFLHFPWKVYRGEFGYYEAWVPPLLADEKHNLNERKNAFYRHSDVEHFLARQDGKVVGRVSAILDHSFNKHNGTNTGFFGFFEAPEDRQISDELLGTVESWLRHNQVENMIGPVNLSTNHIIGALMNDYENPPVVQMAYNPPYYPVLFEQFGMTKHKDLYSYRLSTETLDLSGKIARVQDIARRRNRIVMRNLSIKRDWHWVVPTIRGIYNEAWSRNWGFVPWTEEEFNELAEDLRMIVDEELVLVATIDDEPVAFAIAMPDINLILHRMNGRLFPTGIFKLLAGKKKLDSIRVAAMGVRPRHHNKGLDAVLIYELWTRGTAKGIYRGDFSWILEDNLDLRNLLESWGTEHYRTHRVFGKEL
ncbi:MAG: hypothetical protein ACOCZ9_00885 [Spirochaetota bacterium]